LEMEITPPTGLAIGRRKNRLEASWTETCENSKTNPASAPPCRAKEGLSRQAWVREPATASQAVRDLDASRPRAAGAPQKEGHLALIADNARAGRSHRSAHRTSSNLNRGRSDVARGRMVSVTALAAKQPTPGLGSNQTKAFLTRRRGSAGTSSDRRWSRC